MGLPGIFIVFKLLSFVFASWVLIHVFALFGIFAAITYTFWWYVAPKQTVCFFCKVKKEGEHCPVCHTSIKKSEGDHPKSFFSAIANSILLLIFSVVSVGIVFGESRLLYMLGFPATQKTVTFSIPSKGQFEVGEVFPFKVEIAGIQTPINTVQADIGFDPTMLELVDISTKESFATIFVQKDIDNKVGYVRLTGGLPNPGYAEKTGAFTTLYFRGKKPGTVEIKFLPTTLVLANDGRGTNVVRDLASTSFLILPEKIETLNKPETTVHEETLDLAPTILPEDGSVPDTGVLGAQSADTRWYFYEEKAEVLGESSSSTQNQRNDQFSLSNINFANAIAGYIFWVDTLIMRFWSALIGFIA